MKRINKIFIFIFLLMFFGINNSSNAANITSNEYKVTTKENKSYVIGIYPHTKVQQFKENITANDQIEIYTNNEEKVDDEEKVKTGNIIKVGNKSYIAIVCGDVDGNGEAGLTDLVKIKKQLVGKEELLDDKKIAADIDANGEVTVTDILNLKRLLVRIIDEQDIYEREYQNDEFEYRKNKLTDSITIVRLCNDQLGSILKLPNKIDGNEVKKIEGSLGANDEVKEVIIPNSIENISSIAFSEMKNLTQIQVSQLNEKYSSNDGILYNKAETKIITYPRGKTTEEYYIPENVKEIGEYAFYNNSKTKILYIPESIEKVAPNAFEQMDGNVYIKENSKVKDILEREKISYKVDTAPEIKKLNYKIQQNNKEVNININVLDKEGIVAWMFKDKDTSKEEWINANNTKELNINFTKTLKNNTYTLNIKDKAGNVVSQDLIIDDLDQTVPEITTIKVISPVSGIYNAGQKVTIRAQFSEKIKGTPPELYLKVGKAIVKAQPAVNYLNGNETYIDYVYTTNNTYTGEIEIYSYSGGNVTDIFGNKAEIKALKNTGSKITIKDVIKPTVTSIKVISPVSGAYNPGQKITIRVQFSEIIKGIAPTLRLKIGNTIVTANCSSTYPSGTISYIDYTYTTNYTNSGSVEIYSYTGGNIIDIYGNRAAITTLANTGNTIEIRDVINPTIKTIEILKPVEGIYKAGQEILIRVNFSENIKGIAPKLELKIGNAIGTGAMEVIDPLGTQSYIDYTYTTNNEHSGLVDIYNYSEGTLTDMYGNKAIIEILPNTGNKITIKKSNISIPIYQTRY